MALNGEILKASGSGNGGFDAFIDAVRKILPTGMTLPELLDYELRIPRGGTTGALTEVSITWKDGERTFRTRGVNANQVFAGINATLRMLNVLLHQAVELATAWAVSPDHPIDITALALHRTAL